LERKRRCGWLAQAGPLRAPALVWARGGASLTTCPKSYITPESLALVEEFLLRRHLGMAGFGELTGKQADAFCVLANELAAEERNGEDDAS